MLKTVIFPAGVKRSQEKKLDREAGVWPGGQEKMNEEDSGVEVVHGCLTEGGDSILGAFFCEFL